MELLSSLIRISAHHEFLLPFVGSAIGGEAAVLAITFFAAQGFLPLWTVVLFGFMGSMFADSLIFLLARSSFFKNMRIYKRMLEKYNSRKKQISAISRGKYFYILLIAKFLYGTRTITTIYLSLKPLGFLRYTFMNAIITALWFGVMIPLGWLAGRGFTTLLSSLKKFELILTILILISVILYFVYKKVNDAFLKNLALKKRI
jgi:membrane protein DedA with SNARE-associated domain